MLVAATLVSAERSGRRRMSSTPTAADRCTTTSHDRTSGSMSAGSVAEPTMSRNVGALELCQVRAPACRQVVDRGHLGPVRDEEVAQMGADEAGAAGHEVALHLTTLFAR